MAVQERAVDGIGTVRFQKRRGSRSVRIHVHGNDIKVTLPHYVTYTQAERFVRSRKAWIEKNRKPDAVFSDGSYIGKHHMISIKPGKSLATRVAGKTLTVTLPSVMTTNDTSVQLRVKKAAERILKKESEELITPRVQDLSIEHDFIYKSVSFKKLKTRWGSCDQHNNLVFNIYLVQLPWQLIDYVIVHELAHTLHHNHSKSFWSVVEECLPDFKKRRGEIKQQQPNIIVL